MAAIDRPDLVGDVRFADIGPRAKNIHDLYSIVVDAMKSQMTAEWRRRLDAVDVPNGAVNDFEGLLKNPYLQETGVASPIRGRPGIEKRPHLRRPVIRTLR